MSEHTNAQKLDAIAALLHSQNTLTLSTCDEAGWPQATPLFYLADADLRLYWLSSANSEHSRHVVREPRVAAAVYREAASWKEIRGVQMRGAAAVVTDKLWRKDIVERYCERFHLSMFFRLAITQSELFCFRPSWVRYIDNGTRFGFKFEIALPVAD